MSQSLLFVTHTNEDINFVSCPDNNTMLSILLFYIHLGVCYSFRAIYGHVNSLFPYESSLTPGNDEASLYLQLRDFHMAFQSSRGNDRVNVHHFI